MVRGLGIKTEEKFLGKLIELIIHDFRKMCAVDSIAKWNKINTFLFFFHCLSDRTYGTAGKLHHISGGEIARRRHPHANSAGGTR